MEQGSVKKKREKKYLSEEIINNIKNNSENIMEVIEHFDSYIRRKSIVTINGRRQFSKYFYEEIRAIAMFAAHKFEPRD